MNCPPQPATNQTTTYDYIQIFAQCLSEQAQSAKGPLMWFRFRMGIGKYTSCPAVTLPTVFFWLKASTINYNFVIYVSHFYTLLFPLMSSIHPFYHLLRKSCLLPQHHQNKGLSKVCKNGLSFSIYPCSTHSSKGETYDSPDFRIFFVYSSSSLLPVVSSCHNLHSCAGDTGNIV